ncbi:hypothetical protein [Methanobrevibacter sp.]
MYLNVYVNNGNTPTTFVATVRGDTLTFNVRHSNFRVGDVLTRFELLVNNTTPLFDLGEGVSLFVDGLEQRVIKNSPYTLQFKDTKTHKVQVAYKGNKDIGSAYSNIRNIKASVRADEHEGDVPEEEIDGEYEITIVAPKTIKYMETPNWIFRLTKGKKPIPNRNLEVSTFDQTDTKRTNAKGEVYVNKPMTTLYRESVIDNWGVGVYDIGAILWRYNDNLEKDGIMTSNFQEIEVVKNTPTMTVDKQENSLIVTLTNPLGKPMKNYKINYTLNKQTKSKDTNNDGKIAIPLTNKGTFSYEIESANTKNFNSTKLTGVVTIS